MSPELQRLETEVTESIRHLTPRELQAVPAGGSRRLSIQQIIEHLLNTLRATVAAFQSLLDNALLPTGAPTWRQRLSRLAVLTLRMASPTLNEPMRTVSTGPATLRTAPDLLERLAAELRRLDNLAARVESRYNARPVAEHPHLGPLTAAQWRTFQLLHALHHIREIRAVRRSQSA